ncbi:MAG: tRNA lysidine(34) synthetase TilS [Alphaproteobacteria bacterium]|nr:tRNA lysidine(34) synthetase TilS [Alphaproteobacteria bacterium]
MSRVASAARPEASAFRARLEEDFARAFAPMIADGARVAVAFSGGGDSLALLLLAHNFAGGSGDLLALTVDHRLRPESADEARRAGEIAREIGVRHRVLRPAAAPDAESAVEERARELRYRLLAAALAEEGALHLLVAHTRDDQIETVRLRLASGSGAVGLAAMSERRASNDLRILRPLLAFSRADLACYVAARGFEPVEDPSNRDTRFFRAALRHSKRETTEGETFNSQSFNKETIEGETFNSPSAVKGEAFNKETFNSPSPVTGETFNKETTEGALRKSPSEIAAIHAQAVHIRRRLEQDAARALAITTAISPLGFAQIDPKAAAELPPQTLVFLMRRLITAIGARGQMPSETPAASLAAVLLAPKGDTQPRPTTLGGCRLVPAASADGAAWLVREIARVETAAVPARATQLCDRRFIVKNPFAHPVVFRPLARNFSRLKKLRGEKQNKHLRLHKNAAQILALPAAVGETLPALCLLNDEDDKHGDPLGSILFSPSLVGAVNAPAAPEIAFAPPEPAFPAPFSAPLPSPPLKTTIDADPHPASADAE